MRTCYFCGKEKQGGFVYTAPGGVSRFACYEPDCSEGFCSDQAKRREEEIAQLKQANQCKFHLAWRGWCKGNGHPYCEAHRGELCRVCGKQAALQCDHAVSLVCGLPLCDDCKCPVHGM